jgi:cytochrome c-type biogenesis protein CcmH/NrfG
MTERVPTRQRIKSPRRGYIVAAAVLLLVTAGLALGVKAVRSVDYIPSKNLWIAANRGDVAYLQEAVARQPSSAFRWHALCSGYSSRGEYERAAQACRRALELDPANDYAAFTAGVVAVCSGDSTTVARMREKLKALKSGALQDLDEVASTGCDDPRSTHR